jgi:polar amino acid transport system substrate-binding protein
VAVAAGATVAACGGSSSGGGTASVQPTTSTAADAAVVAKLPAAVKSKGTLTIATDPSYAPDEYKDANGKIIGWDPELAQALGQVMGLKVNVVSAVFATIIPGLKAGRYDLAMSSMTDSKDREKSVDFVTYFKAGTSFFVNAAGGPTISSLEDLCGRKVAVESGTTEETDAKTQSAKCVKEKKAPVDVEAFSDQNQANLALSSGRAQLSMADSPVAGYQIKLSNGKFKLSGQPYGVAPYGIAMPKGNGMAPAVLAALQKLISSGTYTAILQKWGVQAGAITTPQINGATS